MMQKTKAYRPGAQPFEISDALMLIVLLAFALVIVVPFMNVIAISLSSQKEYLDSTLLLFPKQPVLQSYATLFKDGRIWIGYRTTLLLVLVGVPINLFLTSSLAYGLSRGNFPGRKYLMFLIIFTMLFQGGIIPLYLIMKSYKLTNTIWSVVFASGINTFYMILVMNFYSSLPASLVESARLDGAGEWRILLQIILPLSKPILATVALFYLSDRWNEWYNPMIFINKTSLTTLQLTLRSIINDSQKFDAMVSEAYTEVAFSQGIKMAALVVTMLPAMCVFPFLQKYFVKGIKVGAVKA